MEMRFPTLFSILIAVALLAAAGPVWADSDQAQRYYEEAAGAYQNEDFKRAAVLLDLAFKEHEDLVYKYNEILAWMGDGDHRRALALVEAHREALVTDGRFDDIAELHEELRAALDEGDASESDAPKEAASKDVVEDIPEAGKTTSSGPNIAAWSLIGAGVTSLGTGALFASEVLIKDRTRRLDAAIDDGNPTPERLAEIYASENPAVDYENDRQAYQTHHMWKNVFFLGGVVLGATGVTLLVLDIPGTSGEPATALHILPTLGADGVGAKMRWRF
ncbi:MAG: hypothetical protein ACNA8W_18690 [Bradymonadaceae bacterium]